MPLAESVVKRFATLNPFPQPDFLYIDAPVVLMHGFGLMSSFRRGGMLNEAALHLRAHGVAAFAPNVAPYQTVPIRAALWKDRIAMVLNETRAERVHLIAHSMGGLDARYLITNLEMHAQVASLTTVSTPHRGTELARFVLQQPERLRTWTNDLANWLGATTFDETDADFIRAVTELTPEYLNVEFNPTVPDHPDVAYFSYAGCTGKGTNASISPYLMPFNGMLYQREGINDGFVSRASAMWGTYRGDLDADHVMQVATPLGFKTTFDTNGFYTQVVHELAEAFNRV